MRVCDVMTRDVVVCRPENNLAEAACLMWAYDCGILPVVTDTGALVGVITDRDVALAVGTERRHAEDIAVSDVMKRDVYACEPDEDLTVAMDLMEGAHVRRLPVFDMEGCLGGILSLDDIALLALDGPESGISEVEVIALLKAVCGHRTTPSSGC
jgi:CBS domain-containing protein